MYIHFSYGHLANSPASSTQELFPLQRNNSFTLASVIVLTYFKRIVPAVYYIALALTRIHFLGELSFNADSIRQLSIHSSNSKNTYAYQFSEIHNPFPERNWVKVAATHGDEVPFLFGTFYNDENNIWKGRQIFVYLCVFLLSETFLLQNLLRSPKLF